MNQLALFDPSSNEPTYGTLSVLVVEKENKNAKGWTTSKVWSLPGRKKVAEANQLGMGKADKGKVDDKVKELAQWFHKQASGKVGMLNADGSLVITKVRLKKNGGYSIEANPLEGLLKSDSSKPFDPEAAVKAMFAKGMTEEQILDLLEKVSIANQAPIDVPPDVLADIADPATTEHSEPAPETVAEPELVDAQP